MSNHLIVASIAIAASALAAVFGFLMTRNNLLEPTYARPRQEEFDPFGFQPNDNRERRRRNVCKLCQHNLDGCTPRYLKCGHGFHENCIGIWLRDNKHCPDCNRAV